MRNKYLSLHAGTVIDPEMVFTFKEFIFLWHLNKYGKWKVLFSSWCFEIYEVRAVGGQAVL